MKTKNSLIKKVIIVLLCFAVIGALSVWFVNGYVVSIGEERLLTADQAAELENVDCIIVLGCQVNSDGSLSNMLRDRLLRSIELYHAGAAPKIIMSGDHGRENYDEVNAMKQFAMDNGVPSECIFMDHAGFSTYETVYRAKEIFQVEKAIIVTQEYHLYRALYIADQLGLDAYGVPSDLNTYGGQTIRDIREVLARCKDFAMCLLKPEPTYLGEIIPIGGNGDVTNDK